MKLDYLKEGSDDCPLVRLYEFRSADIKLLRQAFADLASGKGEHFTLDQVTPVESVDGTELTFTRGPNDRGIVASGQRTFDIVLTPEGWQRCVGLVEPFCEPSSGYQWLCDDVGRIPLLLSHDGSW